MLCAIKELVIKVDPAQINAPKKNDTKKNRPGEPISRNKKSIATKSQKNTIFFPTHWYTSTNIKTLSINFPLPTKLSKIVLFLPKKSIFTHYLGAVAKK